MSTRATIKKRESQARPRRQVLSDEIYLRIKKMIFNYEILPGAKVNIDALSKELQVSQTPVREALSRLESDGLIVKEPLKGFRATDLLTIKELDNLFNFRLLIEPYAAAEAARKIDETGKRALVSELQSAKIAIKISGDEQVEALTEHDARFHSLIASMSGNSVLAESFEKTHCHLNLFRLYIASQRSLIAGESRAQLVEELFKEYYNSAYGQLAIKEHEEIAIAISSGNAKLSQKSMHHHIESSLKRFYPAANALYLVEPK
ncbi:MAG: GntR family transcriptional regulator [Actinobacteria bacterium]|nr:GntR family transcriptional regulator [Actinomycetota bacterium]